MSSGAGRKRKMHGYVPKLAGPVRMAEICRRMTGRSGLCPLRALRRIRGACAEAGRDVLSRRSTCSMHRR